MAYGNEPAGDKQKEYLGKLLTYWKAKDDRRYTHLLQAGRSFQRMIIILLRSHVSNTGEKALKV